MAQSNGWFRDPAALERAAGRGPDWLAALRRAAWESFQARGFPTTRWEAWRYTNTSALQKQHFLPAEESEPGHPQDEELAGYLLWDPEAIRLAFVDGHFAPHFSQLRNGLPDGARVASLAAVLAEQPERLGAHFTQHADSQEHPFVALNTAVFGDGAFVEVPAGQAVKNAIHLLFISTRRADPTVAHPRNLLLLGAGASATVVETYAGPEGGAYLQNTVTEVSLGAGAALDHYKDQEESPEAYHLGFLGVTLGRDSRFRSHSLAMGGRLGRNEIHARFTEPGGDCELNGLYVADGARHLDNYTLVDHAVPQCTSRENYRGILDDRARGVFHGRVIVRPDAQKTEAHQQNKNLLLSEGASVDTKPQLEIFADDVRCTHGATIGQLEEEAVFYLLSRGIDRETARNMLTRAFASAVIEGVRVAPLRCRIDQRLFHQFEEPEALAVAAAAQASLA